MARIATVFERRRNSRASASTSELFPAPGGPVMPMTRPLPGAESRRALSAAGSLFSSAEIERASCRKGINFLVCRKSVRFVDAYQPGIVACEFVDANGRRHIVIDKAPIVRAEDLNAGSGYPRLGSVRCVVLNRWRGPFWMPHHIPTVVPHVASCKVRLFCSGGTFPLSALGRRVYACGDYCLISKRTPPPAGPPPRAVPYSLPASVRIRVPPGYCPSVELKLCSTVSLPAGSIL